MMTSNLIDLLRKDRVTHTHGERLVLLKAQLEAGSGLKHTFEVSQFASRETIDTLYF